MPGQSFRDTRQTHRQSKLVKYGHVFHKSRVRYLAELVLALFAHSVGGARWQALRWLAASFGDIPELGNGRLNPVQILHLAWKSWRFGVTLPEISILCYPHQSSQQIQRTHLEGR